MIPDAGLSHVSMETRGLFPPCLPEVGVATPHAHLILIGCSKPAQVIQEFAFWTESLWKSRVMHRNPVRLRSTKIREMRGNIPRVLKRFGELRLSLFHRYFRFVYMFSLTISSSFPHVSSKRDTFPSQTNYITPHIRCLLYFISNRTLVFVDSCLNVSPTRPERVWEWRVRMRGAEAGEGAAVSSSTVPAGEAALR